MGVKESYGGIRTYFEVDVVVFDSVPSRRSGRQAHGRLTTIPWSPTTEAMVLYGTTNKSTSSRHHPSPNGY